MYLLEAGAQPGISLKVGKKLVHAKIESWTAQKEDRTAQS